jgi:catechol 2,3-dioxygenase-like lactoylglutathione lyase family enzyme
MIARFKDLCIDANDVRVAAPFWGAVLGLDVEYQGVDRQDGESAAAAGAVLRGATPQHTVWINRVPEPRTVKQRVHLDVIAGSVAGVIALGATRVSADGEYPWTVMADPEGGELCVFPRAQVPAYRLYEVGIDCADPTPIARWWAGVLGARLVEDERGFAYIADIPGAPFESMDFVPVPEPKTVKNRIHWDVTCDALAPLLDAGAAVLRERDEEIGWTVLADPEGNEFCAFAEAPA